MSMPYALTSIPTAPTTESPLLRVEHVYLDSNVLFKCMVNLNSPLRRWAANAEGDLMILSAYASNIERQIEIGLAEFIADRELAKAGEGTPDDIEFEILDGLDTHNWNVDGIYGETLPALHRASALLTICATYENILNGLCRALATELKLDLSIADLKDRGITRAKTYLIKVAGLPIPQPNDEVYWQSVSRIFELRNAFAHANGRIADSKKQLQQYVVAHRALTLEHDKVRLEEGYLHHAVSEFRQLMWLLEKAGKRRTPTG